MSQTYQLEPNVSRAEALVSSLEKDIAGGGLAVGERIGTKADLRSRYGVSPATVNEAIKLLKGKGLIEIRPGPGGGVFIAKPPPLVRFGHKLLGLTGESVSVTDSLAVRAALDELVAVEATLHRTDRDVRRLRDILGKMEHKQDEPLERLRLVWSLHRAMAEISPNKLLSTLYGSLVDYTTARLADVVPDPEQLRHGGHRSHEVHVELVEAVAAQDVERTRRAARNHRELTGS